MWGLRGSAASVSTRIYFQALPIPASLLLWLVVFWIRFQTSLLEFVSVRWCPDVVSMSCVLQFVVILRADVFSFDAQIVSVGMLVAYTLAPLGTSERSRDTSELKKEHHGAQAWIPFDFFELRGSISSVF